MKITAIQEEGILVVQVEGRLDVATAPEFEKNCAAMLEQGHEKLVLDLTDLEYISSAGLRSLLAIAKRLKGSGGSLSLCGLTGLVKEVFYLSGFDSFLPVYEGRQQALAGGGK
jgi:anti-anti-sigma factor